MGGFITQGNLPERICREKLKTSLSQFYGARACENMCFLFLETSVIADTQKDWPRFTFQVVYRAHMSRAQSAPTQNQSILRRTPG